MNNRIITIDHLPNVFETVLLNELNKTIRPVDSIRFSAAGPAYFNMELWNYRTNLRQSSN